MVGFKLGIFEFLFTYLPYLLSTQHALTINYAIDYSYTAKFSYCIQTVNWA